MIPHGHPTGEQPTLHEHVHPHEHASGKGVEESRGDEQQPRGVFDANEAEPHVAAEVPVEVSSHGHPTDKQPTLHGHPLERVSGKVVEGDQVEEQEPRGVFGANEAEPYMAAEVPVEVSSPRQDQQPSQVTAELTASMAPHLVEVPKSDGRPNRSPPKYSMGVDPADDFTSSDDDTSHVDASQPTQDQQPHTRPSALHEYRSVERGGGATTRGRGRGRGGRTYRAPVGGRGRTYRAPELSAAFQKMHMASSNPVLESVESNSRRQSPVPAGKRNASSRSNRRPDRTLDRKKRPEPRAVEELKTRRGADLGGKDSSTHTTHLDHHDSSASSIREALFETIHDNRTASLLPMAKRLLSELGLLAEYTVEEWAYFKSEHGFQKSQNFGVGGDSIIKIGKFHNPSHYVLLDHTTKPDMSRGLEMRTEDRPYYEGTVTLTDPKGAMSFATVVDQGQYPWGRDDSSKPLEDICATLHIFPDSGVANRCSYTHLMMGLIANGFQVQQLLEAIKPSEADPERNDCSWQERLNYCHHDLPSGTQHSLEPPERKTESCNQGHAPTVRFGTADDSGGHEQTTGGDPVNRSSELRRHVGPPAQRSGPRLEDRPVPATTVPRSGQSTAKKQQAGAARSRSGRQRPHTWKHRTRKNGKEDWNRQRGPFLPTRGERDSGDQAAAARAAWGGGLFQSRIILTPSAFSDTELCPDP